MNTKERIREIQLDLLEQWLVIMLEGKKNNPKGTADTLMSMKAIDESILDILDLFKPTNSAEIEKIISGSIINFKRHEDDKFQFTKYWEDFTKMLVSALSTTLKPSWTEGLDCGICGGKQVYIRGRYPHEDKRLVCPDCCASRLDQIREIADKDYGKCYTATCKQALLGQRRTSE
jgi:hypothetical protein